MPVNFRTMMQRLVFDEIELGRRAAAELNDPNQCLRNLTDTFAVDVQFGAWPHPGFEPGVPTPVARRGVVVGGGFEPPTSGL